MRMRKKFYFLFFDLKRLDYLMKFNQTCLFGLKNVSALIQIILEAYLMKQTKFIFSVVLIYFKVISDYFIIFLLYTNYDIFLHRTI